VWWFGGELKTHSKVLEALLLTPIHPINFSSLTKASYIININQITPIIDTMEPSELTKFHVTMLSGKSE